MKSIVRERYGSPDVLELRDADKPVLDDDSVLVKVRAASINAYDWHMMRGLPFLARMSEGLRKPKSIAMGVDVAGQVEAVGKNVTHLRPGDEVFGARSGALAEYVRGSAKSFLVPKPAGLTFEQAAAMPMAATTALAGPSRQRAAQGGADGPDQWSGGWRRHVRRADRKSVRSTRDGRVQHAERGHGPFDRRG